MARHKRRSKHSKDGEPGGRSTVQCEHCEGTGKVLRIDWSGHGKHKYDECIWCRGRGRVEE